MPLEAPAAAADEADVPEGVFHRVEAGQTLWRIARAYGVDWNVLARANHVRGPQDLTTGQVLFVPGARVAVEVAPYPAAPPNPPVAPVPPARPAAPPIGVTELPALQWPVAGGTILSAFGTARRGHRHAGLDIRGEHGQDVVAAEAGEVAFSADTLGAYGKLVILEHSGRFETLYAHNSELLVKAGDSVVRGQVVARVGRTGNASADHCHFELRKDKRPLDPMLYFPLASAAQPSVASKTRLDR